MLKIRLSRTGKKHQPRYRVVVAEHTAPVQGKFVDLLGHYNPHTKELVLNDSANLISWLDRGAQPSNRVAKILTAQGIKHKLIKVHLYPERPSKKNQDESVQEGPDQKLVKTEKSMGEAEVLKQQSDALKQGVQESKEAIDQGKEMVQDDAKVQQSENPATDKSSKTK